MRRRVLTRLPVALALISAVAGSLAPAAASASQGGARATAAHLPQRSAVKPSVVYRGLRLMDGKTATVFSNGMAEVLSHDGQSVEYRMIPPAAGAVPGTAAALPAKPQLTFDLSRAPAVPYTKGELEVVLAAGVEATAAQRSVGPAELAQLRHATTRAGAPATGTVPAYTTNTALNRQLAGLGTASMTRVFRGVPASVMHSLAATAGNAGAGSGPIDLSRVYTVKVTNASMPVALAALTASPAVAYAAPDWTVTPLATSPVPVPASSMRAADAMAARMATGQRRATAATGDSSLPALPSNFGLQSSAQSMLNSTATNWVPAYEALESHYHQLPGTGEVITDVSLGDLTSADIAASDPCSSFEAAFGPTTIVKNGQRFLDLPSMPLIPTWTSDASATLDPVGDACGVDPSDVEIDLDFAMMSPLPHDQQRPDALGSGLTDLLGIAPGASYRLVVPSDTSGSVTSVDAAFLAAAQQSPRPNVITASLGFGLDSEGMPSRYLEDDPVTQALIASLTKADHITVAVSANDGLRAPTNAAVSPSGGSAATNVPAPGQQPTSLDDVQLSGAPSVDPDSGAIDVGAVTLDDIAAAEPQAPASGQEASQQAFPEVRWDGSANFSSGYGSRVNLSAPGDNLLAFEHTVGGTAQSVTVVDNGGTSASVQEAGAAAAVVQQAARLTGDKSVASSPGALRAYLEHTATPVPNVPEADQPLNVGPQVNLGDAVTGLLQNGGVTVPPSVPRVAVAQRQNTGGFGSFFQTATDPSAISLTGSRQNDWLTIAPDWTGLPGNGVSYRLSARRQDGSEQQLATGPSARLQPDAIIAAAGLQPSAQQPVSVTLSYTATARGHVIAQAAVPLTFGPQSGTPTALAPVVAPVVTGDSFSVHYDLTGQTGFTAPILEVSAPGRMDPFQPFYQPIYSVPLQGTTGTVRVPVSALHGGGIYGVAVQAAPGQFAFTQFAFTRVQPSPSDAQPAAPLLSAPGQPAGHLLTIPYTGKFTVAWDVRAVPHASGALLEVSTPGPTVWNSDSTFNNPGGTVNDHNGRDRGSIFSQRLAGRSGRVTLSAAAAGLDPAMFHNVRVIPLLGSGAAAGEASPVSTITRNGIVPADGGSVLEGFGVDAHGGDGLVTSNQVTAQGQTLSSVDTFDQATNSVTGVLASATDGADQFSTANGAEAGIFAGDTALYADTHIPGFTTTYTTVSPLAQGGTTGTWTPPGAPVGAQVVPADNQDTSTDALLIGNFQLGFRVLSTDFKSDTFGPSAGLPLSSFAIPEVTGFGEDTATGTAVAGAFDLLDGVSPPTLLTVDLASGAIHRFTGVGTGFPLGVAVDSAAGTAVMPTVGSVGLYDVATGQGTQINPGGFSYQHPAADPQTGDFLVEEVAPPGAELVTPGLGATPDNGSVSSIVVLNQQGQTVSRLEQFNYFNFGSLDIGDFVQINPATRAGYTLGPLGQELAPFSY